MGTPVPPGMPELEDDKVYRVVTDVYWGPGPETGCDQPWQQRMQCCVQGDFLKNWLANDECRESAPLCVAILGAAERCVAIHGPYDNAGDCQVDIP